MQRDTLMHATDKPSTSYLLSKIKLFDMISALTTALDLLNPELGRHQKRTCLIAAHIAQRFGITGVAYEDVFGAAIFHDIGAIALSDRLSLQDLEETDTHTHAQLGALLLSRFPSFKRYATLVKHHHVQWRHGLGGLHDGEHVHLLSHLIYLAESIEVLAQGKDNILADAPQIRELIKASNGSKFHPAFVEVFLEISKKESFWLDIFSNNLDEKLVELAPFENIELDLNHMLLFARFIALMIDSRSHFTATHSAGVAITASIIAKRLGMSEFECAKIRIAGYLHDLGKLAIPSELIERHGALTIEEMAKVKSHSYITFDILSNLNGLEDVALWAAYHHERLDGSGYPFRKTAAELPLGARIIAVADVYTALTEDRPYRAGLERSAVLKILASHVDQGKLDGIIFSALELHIYEIETLRTQAQLAEGLELKDFWQMAQQSQPNATEPLKA